MLIYSFELSFQTADVLFITADCHSPPPIRANTVSFIPLPSLEAEDVSHPLNVRFTLAFVTSYPQEKCTVGLLTVDFRSLKRSPLEDSPPEESPEPPPCESFHKSTHAVPFHLLPTVRATHAEPFHRLREETSVNPVPEYLFMLMLSPHQNHRSPVAGLEGCDCCTKTFVPPNGFDAPIFTDSPETAPEEKPNVASCTS